MTLPSSFPLSASQINVELGRAPDAPFSITGEAERQLAGIPSGPISFSDFLGKSAQLLTPVAVVGSNTSTITIPASAQAGDLAVMYDFALGTIFAPASAVPSGWTSPIDEPASLMRGAVSYRILTSGNPGSTIAGMNGAGRNRKIMRVLRGGSPVTSVTAGDWTQDLSPGGVGPLTVTAAPAATPLIVIAFAASENDVDSFASSPAFDTVNGVSVTRSGYKNYASGTASNHTINSADRGDSNGLSAGYFQISF